MKTFPRTLLIAPMAFLILGLLLWSAQPSDAGKGGGHGGGHHGGHHHHHHFHHFGGRSHVFVGVGPWFWGPPYPYWWGYPYYYAPPPVIVQEPPVYIQSPAPPPPAYWYYCPSAKAYYPIAPSCPESWIQVPARSP